MAGRFRAQVLQGQRRARCRVAETLVLGQGRDGAEALEALGALDLHSAIRVHALVPAQIRELGVRLEADLTLERFHGGVDVRVLFEAGRGRECFSAFGTGVTPGANVVRPNVALKVRWIGEDLQK